MSFIDSVLRYTIDRESPRKYYYWSALASISAIVKSNVWCNVAGNNIMPNIFVLLVGRSGLRKGPPVNLATNLVNTVNNTRVFKGRVSIQGMITNLSMAQTHKEGGPPRVDASGFLVASEFASFIIQDPAAMTILTDLYDGHYNKEWSYMLKGAPPEKLKQPCLTMIGASNEIHLKDAVPSNAIGGGFVARTAIIYADKKSTVNPGIRNQITTIPQSVLTDDLAEIAKCRGAFTWIDEAADIYEKWYYRHQEKEKLEEDTTGTLERLHDHIIKVAMLVSLSRARDLVITVSDIKEAIVACEDFVPASRKMGLFHLGTSQDAPGTGVLLRELINSDSHEISRTEALRKHWSHFSASELDRIAESLFAQKAIKITLRREGNSSEIIYQLSDKVVERYKAKYQDKS